MVQRSKFRVPFGVLVLGSVLCSIGIAPNNRAAGEWRAWLPTSRTRNIRRSIRSRRQRRDAPRRVALAVHRSGRARRAIRPPYVSERGDAGDGRRPAVHRHVAQPGCSNRSATGRTIWSQIRSRTKPDLGRTSGSSTAGSPTGVTGGRAAVLRHRRRTPRCARRAVRTARARVRQRRPHRPDAGAPTPGRPRHVFGDVTAHRHARRRRCRIVVLDPVMRQTGAPGDVRGFDAHTGRLRWTFHDPRAGRSGQRDVEKATLPRGRAMRTCGRL